MTDKLIGGSIGAATGLTGLAKWVEMIPDGIGKVACLVGIFLSLLAAYTTFRKSQFDSRLAKLEIKKRRMDLEKIDGDKEPYGL